MRTYDMKPKMPVATPKKAKPKGEKIWEKRGHGEKAREERGGGGCRLCGGFSAEGASAQDAPFSNAPTHSDV